MKLAPNLEITVWILSNGQRVISEEGLKQFFEFIGITKEEFIRIGGNEPV